ncbi:MAG: TIGR03557 family F420-dependent LLM class oxidoreductase [Actinobacteria bacterium]|nr:TIGR03557 family F420-dependent LLM class oxidoreductase [Actinomycetota bacterium]
MQIGYTLMCEQAGPRDLVRFAAEAEEAGFPFAVMSDHYFPWLDSQGHSSYAWSVLGAVAQATQRLELMTYVTCPTVRYHPAVVAQKAATIGLLSDGRFTLGLGAGENLNEHVVGGGWPPVNVRHDMLGEALDIIDALFDGGYVSYRGRHFHVNSAKLWDLPERRVPIGVAVSGPQSVDAFAPKADVMISTEPDPELGPRWDAARASSGSSSGTARKVGQLPVSWDADENAAVARAHDQFRWFAGGWKVNAELPGTAAFAGASQFVRPEDVAQQLPCGDSVEKIVEGVRPFVEAGYTDVALVQIGGDAQGPFLEAAAKEILPGLAEAFA